MAASIEDSVSMRVIWALVVGILFLGVAAFVFAVWNWSEMEERAQFGDLLSGVAGLIGFLGMATALVLQTLELRAQREELRLTREDSYETRLEITAQTQLFEIGTNIADEQLEATKRQNELLSRQLMLTHLPLLSMRWDATEQGVALVVRNRGHGQALINDLRFKVPSWSGPDRRIFLRQLENHGRASPASVEFGSVDTGTLVDPHSDETVLVVRAQPKSMANLGGFAISLTYVPAQGGAESSLSATLSDIAELGE